MKHLPVYIHGLGLITGLDQTGESTWDAIAANKRLSTHGVVSDALLRVTTEDRALRLAICAAQSALNESRWNNARDDTRLFVGSSKGLLLTALQACDAVRHHQPLTDAQSFAITRGPAAVGDFLCTHFDFRCGAHTSVAACASGLFALHAAMRALRSGECRRAVIVATDASLHPLIEGSFQRLGLIAPADADGRRWCNPFDASGAGFFLSEAAAALTISLDPPEDGSTLHIENTWIGADAGHLLAIDEQTSSLRAGIRKIASNQALDFVHAHATGTAHDAYELAAIRHVCGEAPEVFSSKYWLGHSLGAAGLVSLVLSAQCHRRGRTLRGKTLPRHARSITVAQGFGGHIAVAALRDEAPGF